MAYSIESLDLDKENTDPYKETRLANLGPYDCAGGAENTIAVIESGSLSNVGVIVSDIKAQGSTIRVYGCNQPRSSLHGTAPHSNNRVLLLDTLTVAAGGSDGGFLTGSWKFLIFTEESAGAETENIMIDIHAETRS